MSETLTTITVGGRSNRTAESEGDLQPKIS